MQKMAYQRFGTAWAHLILDADTVPPDDWKPKEIAEDTLYGCSRILFECLKDFENNEFGIILVASQNEIIGFFQLYKASKEYFYNIYHTTADLSDIAFSGLFNAQTTEASVAITCLCLVVPIRVESGKS
jgi:hypothetical protein